VNSSYWFLASADAGAPCFTATACVRMLSGNVCDPALHRSDIQSGSLPGSRAAGRHVYLEAPHLGRQARTTLGHTLSSRRHSAAGNASRHLYQQSSTMHG
jgi:hypothetical protein